MMLFGGHSMLPIKTGQGSQLARHQQLPTGLFARPSAAYCHLEKGTGIVSRPQEPGQAMNALARLQL